MIYILLEPVRSEHPHQQIYVLNHLPYVHPLCNVCIVMNLTSVFQHQEDRPLKLQRKLRKIREIEAYKNWDLSDLVTITFMYYTLQCSCDIGMAGKKKKALPLLAAH